MRWRAGLLLAAAAWTVAGAPARADEGFWTADRFPSERFVRVHGTAPSRATLLRIERATLRAGDDGTSGTLVSEDGLVLTARHVIPRASREAIAATLREGFVARRRADELPVPGMRFDRIESVEDVTARLLVPAATPGAPAPARLAEAIASLQREASASSGQPVQVVRLLGGARFLLYRYHRYTDVRLVFAPEDAIGVATAAYPAPVFDCALLRVYEDGRPARTPGALPVARRGPAEGEPVLIGGAPYATSRRHMPAAELRLQRDVEIPLQREMLVRAADRLAALLARREIRDEILEGVVRETSFAAAYRADVLDDLRDPATVARRGADDQALIGRLRSSGDADGLAVLAEIEAVTGEIASRYARSTFVPFTGAADQAPWRGGDADPPWSYSASGSLLRIAAALMRAREERLLPDAERTADFRDALRGPREAWLFAADCAVCPRIADAQAEELWLATYLESLEEVLGAEDPMVMALLAGSNAKRRAHDLVAATRLRDPAFRKAVYQAERLEPGTLSDPLMEVMQRVWPLARTAAREHDALRARLAMAADRYVAVLAREQGDALYPDASASVRIGYGTVRAFTQEERRYGDPPWRRYPTFLALDSVFDRAGDGSVPASLGLPPR